MLEKSWIISVTLILSIILAISAGNTIWNALIGIFVVFRFLITLLGLLVAGGFGILVGALIYLFVERKNIF